MSDEVIERTINRFQFRFQMDEGYWDVTYLEPKTNTWELLMSVGRSFDYVLKQATEEASHWDFDEE
jgi:hypothetical protein